MDDVSGDLVSTLRSHAFPLGDAAGAHVPEPFVKATLAQIGVPTPAGAVILAGDTPSKAVEILSEPLVLKAWGPGIIHKSDLGAVRVGIPKSRIDEEAASMLEGLKAHGVRDARLFVEEMAQKGTEILFGVVARPPFGNLAVLGVGGTNAELFGEPALRLAPIDEATAREMIDSFQGSALLKGHRGTAKADTDALVSAMLAIAGKGGLIERLGEDFAEFECNPLSVSERGVVALDARLVLHHPDRPTALSRPFEAKALFAPKSVAVVGASATRPTAWGNRTLARYRGMGWTENLYAVHPTGQIEGYPTYKSLADIPGGVDYAEVSVAAEAAPAALRAAGGNLKTAVVTAAGFSELGEQGRELQAELLQAAIEGGVRFVGPNCMGVFSPRGRQGYSGAVSKEAGHIGAMFQSGGLSTNMLQAGQERGLKFSSIVSAGNTADVKVSDLFAYFVDDPDTKIIALHVEGGADNRLTELLRRARGVKPVVLLAPGLSATGARTAQSHTGAMTSDRRGWQALSAATGLTVTTTLEEFVSALSYLDRYVDHLDSDNDAVLVIGLGGGASVLGGDACDAAGLRVPLLSEELQAKLGDKKGGILLNPLDLRMGPAGPPSAARTALETVLPVQPFADVMIHVDILGYLNSTLANRLPGVSHLAAMVESLSEQPALGARIAIVTRNLEYAPGSIVDEVRAIAKANAPAFFDRFSDAAAAIAAAKRFSRHKAALKAG